MRELWLSNFCAVFLEPPVIINNDDLKNINYIRYNEDIYQFHSKYHDKFTQVNNRTNIFMQYLQHHGLDKNYMRGWII